MLTLQIRKINNKLGTPPGVSAILDCLILWVFQSVTNLPSSSQIKLPNVYLTVSLLFDNTLVCLF